MFPIGEMYLLQDFDSDRQVSCWKLRFRTVFKQILSEFKFLWEVTEYCIPTGNFKFPIGILFSFKIIFSCRNLFLKGKYLTCQVRYNDNKCGYALYKQWSILWHICIFLYMKLRRVQKCNLSTGIRIRHSVIDK